MKKIFLTSGLVLCMACPAFATDINYSNSTYSDADCVSDVLGVTSGQQTLHAKWTKNQYDVTYAHGTHGTGGQTITNAATYDNNYRILGIGTGEGFSGVTANTGYHFVEWAGSSAEDEDYQETTYTETQTISPYQVAGELTLTAQWTWNTSTITLDSSMYPSNAHGGTATYNTANGVTASTPSPIYGAYDHGFYDSTAHAIAGGTGDGSGNLSGVSVPTLTGYTFNGFFADANDANPVINSDGSFANNAHNVVSGNEATATWYAHWSPIGYTLTYSCGSYTGTYNSQQFTRTSESTINAVPINYDANIATTVDPATACTLNGYHINASNPWTCVIHDHTTGAALTGEGSTVSYDTLAGTGTTWKVANDVTCTANWEPNEIQLTWNNGGGDTVAVPQGSEGLNTCTYDLGITPATPTRTGYTFSGWTTDSSAAADADYVIFNNGQPSITQ